MITDTVRENHLSYFKIAPDYFELQLDERVEPNTLIGYDFYSHQPVYACCSGTIFDYLYIGKDGALVVSVLQEN
jgi:hypothetical protein